MDMGVTSFSTLPRDFDLDRIAPGGRIGLISLATDFNIEDELRLMLPDSVGLYVNRVRNANPLTVENLRAMEADLARAADGILPGLGVDVMVYACTSGSAAIGSEQIEARIHSVCPGVTVANPIVAVRKAFAALGARKVSVLTPYIDSVNRTLIPAMAAGCADVLNVAGFGMDDDIDVTGIPLERIKTQAIATCHEDADLIFLSCTALRGARVIAELEQALGKPVLTSNQVLAWYALRLLGNREPINGYGRLFEMT